MAESKRFTHIDLLETIAIFFVIVYHSTLYSFNFLVDNSLLSYLRYFFRTILSTCVPLFFFANGYLLLGKPFNLRKHISKTVKLVLLTVTWAIITLFALQEIRQEYFTFREFIAALWSWKQNWINHFWFMGALVCVYVFFPLIKSVFDSNKKLFIYFVIICAIFTLGNTLLNQAATVCASVFFHKSIALSGNNFFSMFNPFRGIYGFPFVYFCAGGLMYSYQDKLLHISAKLRNTLCVIGLLVSCTALFLLGILYSKINGEIWAVVWNGYDTVFTFLNVIFIHTLCLNWKADSPTIRFISNNTLGVYFMHNLLMWLIRPYLLEYAFCRTYTATLFFAFILLVLCLLLCHLIKKVPLLSKLL